jgi:hypothetical protein
MMCWHRPAARRCSWGRWRLLLGVFAVFVAVTARTETFRIDDSASQVLDSSVRMQWEAPAPGRSGSQRVLGQATVLVRLAIGPWRGRTGRIFMTLPARPEGAIEATWTTRGRLQPGSLRSGERIVVFAGALAEDLVEDTLVIRIAADGESMERDEALEFGFEIEVD